MAVGVVVTDALIWINLVASSLCVVVNVICVVVARETSEKLIRIAMAVNMCAVTWIYLVLVTGTDPDRVLVRCVFTLIVVSVFSDGIYRLASSIMRDKRKVDVS